MTLPTVEQILHEHLIAERDGREARHDPLPNVLHASASSAGACARAVAFRVAAVPATNPPTADSLINFYIGDSVHDIVQRAIVARWPNATTEVSGTIDDFLSGHADVIYFAEDGEKVVCEIKSVSDFAFELATGAELKSNGRWRKKDRQPEGPKREHLLQNLIYAQMHDAKYIAVVYARKTATKDEPILHEWRFTAEDFTEETQAEIDRLRDIVALVRQGKYPDREYAGEIIKNPLKVRFPCGYCSYISACVSAGWGEVEIKELPD